MCFWHAHVDKGAWNHIWTSLPVWKIMYRWVWPKHWNKVWVFSLCIISYTYFSFLLYANILTSLGQGGKPNLRRALGYSSKLEMAFLATTVFNMKPTNTVVSLKNRIQDRKPLSIYILRTSVLFAFIIYVNNKCVLLSWLQIINGLKTHYVGRIIKQNSCSLIKRSPPVVSSVPATECQRRSL